MAKKKRKKARRRRRVAAPPVRRRKRTTRRRKSPLKGRKHHYWDNVKAHVRRVAKPRKRSRSRIGAPGGVLSTMRSIRPGKF